MIDLNLPEGPSPVSPGDRIGGGDKPDDFPVDQIEYEQWAKLAALTERTFNLEHEAFNQRRELKILREEAIAHGLLLEELAQLQADATVSKATIERLDVLAHQDALTGLCNRNGYNRSLLELHESEPDGDKIPIAIIYIDLDNFKGLNDSLGHEFGDKVLIAFAKVIQASTREGDILARYGGDEFVLCLPQEDGALDSTELLADLREKFQICLAEMQSTIDVGSAGYQHLQSIEFSMGIGTGVLGEIEQHSKTADKAMYKEKSERSIHKTAAAQAAAIAANLAVTAMTLPYVSKSTLN